MPPKYLKDIVLEYVNKSGMRFPVAEISKATGYSDGTVSEYLSGKKPISDNFFRKFCEVFKLSYADYKGLGNFAKTTIIADDFESPTDEVSDISPKLSTSKEVKFFGKNPNMRLKPEEYAEAFGDWKGLPIYNSPITASFIETYRDTSHMEPYYYLHDPRFKDCDFGAIITGDSMYPEIRHGDIVLCKIVEDKRFIVFGDIYYIVASNGLETCKYINKDHDDPKNSLLLVARNNSIDPSPLPKDMLIKLYKLRGLIRGY